MSEKSTWTQGAFSGEGLVTVITGHGKGKTTSAIGTAVRAAGHGLKVFIMFFLKGNDYEHGEFESLSNITNITFGHYGHKGWSFKEDNSPERREQARKAFDTSKEAIMSGKYDIVILDEVNMVVASGMVPIEELIYLIENKPKKVELILTGRKADPQLVRLADLVSEILMIKHPFNEGVRARKGIDY